MTLDPSRNNPAPATNPTPNLSASSRSQVSKQNNSNHLHQPLDLTSLMQEHSFVYYREQADNLFLHLFQQKAQRDAICISHLTEQDCHIFFRHASTGNIVERTLRLESLETDLVRLHEELVEDIKKVCPEELKNMQEVFGQHLVPAEEVPKKRLLRDLGFAISCDSPGNYRIFVWNPYTKKIDQYERSAPLHALKNEVAICRFLPHFSALNQASYPASTPLTDEGHDLGLEDFYVNHQIKAGLVYIFPHVSSQRVRLIFRDPLSGLIQTRLATEVTPEQVKQEAAKLSLELEALYEASLEQTLDYLLQQDSPSTTSNNNNQISLKDEFAIEYDFLKNEFTSGYWDPLDQERHDLVSGGVGLAQVKAMVGLLQRSQKYFAWAEKHASKIDFLSASDPAPTKLAGKRLCIQPSQDYENLRVFYRHPSKKGVLSLQVQLGTSSKAIAKLVKQSRKQLRSFRVHPSSLKKTYQSPKLPELGDEIQVNVESYIELFQQVKTPSDVLLTNDGIPTNRHDLEEGMRLFVQQIQNQSTFVGTPEKKEDKDKLFAELRHLSHYVLYQLEQTEDDHLRDRVLMEIAEAGSHCASRYLATLHAACCSLNDNWNISNEGLMGEIERLFDELKRGTLEEMILEGGNSENAHEYIQYLNILNQHGIGLFGAQVGEVKDPFDHLSMQGRYKNQDQFLTAYRLRMNSDRVLSFFQNALNEMMKTQPETVTALWETLIEMTLQTDLSENEQSQLKEIEDEFSQKNQALLAAISLWEDKDQKTVGVQDLLQCLNGFPEISQEISDANAHRKRSKIKALARFLHLQASDQNRKNLEIQGLLSKALEKNSEKLRTDRLMLARSKCEGQYLVPANPDETEHVLTRVGTLKLLCFLGILEPLS